MCGIVGMSGEFEISELIDRLERLEYRGYDSAGLVTDTHFEKTIKGIADLRKGITKERATKGISHTRWATHGGVTEKNAHPHANCSHKIFAVHNGILNVRREELEQKGYVFTSDTDSEFIVHYFDHYLSTHSMPEICQRFIDEIDGTFAILILHEGTIYCLKRDSPLAIGTSDDTIYIASDIHAFSDKTDSAIFLEDDTYAIISSDIKVFRQGRQLQPKPESFGMYDTDHDKRHYEHHMLKEIEEQPRIAKNLIDSFPSQKEALEKATGLIRDNKIVLLGCGTSYHAALIGEHLLKQCGIDAQAHIASEYAGNPDLIIAFSQSGETMDLLRCIKQTNSKVISIVNVPASTLHRMSDVTLDICAGKEIAVASTKAFTNQVILLFKIASLLGISIDIDKIPGKIEQVIRDTAIDPIVNDRCFVLGKGLFYPVAREIALKLKEVTYVHAEPVIAGELKHGPLALVEPGFPVLSLADAHTNAEVRARGGELMELPCSTLEDVILSTIRGHLMSYQAALKKGLPIDKPRNLAKSVTVT
ncbi:MAG: glutamine--fructose-6-phosphate transaminase (isomerizing) [Candidatus Woesearchaeota archaeon]